MAIVSKSGKRWRLLTFLEWGILLEVLQDEVLQETTHPSHQNTNLFDVNLIGLLVLE